jgi:hypothetical protein
MLYPNRLQAALLFDRRVDTLDEMLRAFTRIEGMRSDARFHQSETNPGLFYRLFEGTEELMVTFEYCDRPADPAVFRAALGSPYTGILTPDIRERIARSQSHILLEVSHGVMGGVEENPEIAALFEQIGQPRSGATPAQFARRLAVLALMSRVAIDHAMPLAVHWTQSDLLVGGELFDRIAADADVPSPLHIHPFLFGPRPEPGEPARVGLRTFGARHWLGREIVVQPNILPWAANLETVFAFLRVATMPGGYVIPDGDTFGPEDRSQSFRVLHHDAGAAIGAGVTADLPLYELVPLKHEAHGYLAPDHVPEANVFDDRSFPPELMPDDQEAKRALANEWAQKRKLAEGIGGRFEVRQKGEAGPAAPPRVPARPAPVIAPTPSQPGLPSLSGRGLRARLLGREEA